MMSEKKDNGSEKGYLKLCEVTPNEYENKCWPVFRCASHWPVTLLLCKVKR